MRGFKMQFKVWLAVALVCGLVLDAPLCALAASASRTTRLGLGAGVADGVRQQGSDSAYKPKDKASRINGDDIRQQSSSQLGEGQASQGGIQESMLPTGSRNSRYGLRQMPLQERMRQARIQSVPQKAPPAWAQGEYPAPFVDALRPFGADLFLGNFAGTWQSGLQPQYAIMPGDRIAVRVWGAVNFDGVLPVDQQGNIFIPEVGPIDVVGVPNSQLQRVVSEQISEVFTNNVEVYTDLLSTQPVAVFVTGNVMRPGRYAGGPGDSILFYLDNAGGIAPDRGSYRHIVVKRGRHKIADIDLYDFLVKGDLPDLHLEDGDVILVEKRGAGVSAMGLIRQPARYEFDDRRGIKGKALIAMAQPQPGASHVSISGTRRGASFNAYMTLQEFNSFSLRDEDIVEFHADQPGSTLMVGAAGAITGASRFAVRKGTRLHDLLWYVGVDASLAATDAIYVRRRSVAEQQKKAIQDSLVRLEQTALTARSQSVDEANIRVREAELIQDFVKRATRIEPDGVVVVSRKGNLQNLILEEGDIVYVPQKSDVVQVVGEVAIPKAVVFESKLKVKDYVQSAGGFNDRADTGNVLVMKPNGEIGKVNDLGIAPGDQLMVMPLYDSKTIQSVKDIVQIIYQMAVAAGVVLIPFWKN